jgi:transposase
MPAGRPTKYKPEFCQMIIDTMSTGASIVTFCSENKIARDTVSEWAKVHPEFSAALKQAQTNCQAWWEHLFRATATGKIKGNLGAQIFWMKNRFANDWKDRVDHIHTAAENPIKLAYDVTQRLQIKERTIEESPTRTEDNFQKSETDAS